MSVSAASGDAEPAPLTRLPPLRQELDLHPGPRTVDGAPGWILQDPASHRFFRLGWLEFEILSRWHLGTVEAVVADLRGATTLDVGAEDVDAVVRFVAAQNLIQVRGPTALDRLRKIAWSQRKWHAGWLLKNYLFLRIPLVRPDAFLDATGRYVRWMWSRAFFAATAVAGLAGLVLVAQQWETFFGTFLFLFSAQGVMLAAAALMLAKVVHELAHAYTAKRYGCRVPTMGVAFLVLWPVLYTDGTDAWRLPSRRQRLAIGAAGMVAELMLAAYATLAWSFLADGPVRSAVFLLATATWVMTLAVNLNPFMRFDGYYLLSDLLRIPNLQDRAFALARWRLREALFGYGEAPPEHFGRGTRRTLLAYAYATWAYRFVLFLGIALLVYYFFFKLLGIFLMVVELAWFIGRPITREIGEWIDRGRSLTVNPATVRTAGAAAALAFLLFFPWQGSLSAPAIWRAAQHAHLYAPAAGQTAAVHVAPGQHVARDAGIVTLAAPDLVHALEQGRRRVATLQWQVQFQGVSPELQQRSQVIARELEAETASQNARIAEHAALSIRSPIDGIVVERLHPLAPGDWLREGEWLATVVAPGAGAIEAWISERDVERVEPGATGRFYPADARRQPFDVRIVELDRTGVREFAEPYLVSTFGGPIAVREAGDGRWIPEVSVYRAMLVPVDDLGAPVQVLRGHVRLVGERRSLAVSAARAAYGLLIRESGF